MKKVMLPFLIALLFIVPIGLMGISLTDYTVTDTYFQEAYLNGSFNFTSGNQPKASYNGRGFANYKTQYSTLPLTWNLEANSSFDFAHGSAENDSLTTGYNLNANSNADKYFTNSKIFGYGSINTGYRKNINSNKADKPFAKIGLGGGYGRVFDATVLARTMRYIDDLKKYGMITSNISDKAYLELAKIIDKEMEYKAKYGPIEYKKYWFEDMEKVLSSENVLKNNRLSALGVIRMEEILNERVSVRRHGWSIRTGIGYVLSNYDGSKSKPSLDLGFEYALPFKYNFQLIEKMNYSTILSGKATQMITNNFSLTFQLSDKIDWENYFITEITLPSDKDKKNIISNTFTSAYYYYIANSISANISLSLSKLDDGIKNNGNDDVNSNIMLGIQYRIR